MINRINLILRAKNITARQFAEEIGIQPSGMSHILGGRNNPSLDFVTKVIRRYPEIDANWLLLGRGEMYTAATAAHAAEPVVQKTENAVEKTLFSVDEEPVSQDDTVDAPLTPAADGQVDEESRAAVAVEPDKTPVASEPCDYRPTYIAVPPEAEPSSVARHGRRLVRMLFIYNDNTFSEFLPAESASV